MCMRALSLLSLALLSACGTYVPQVEEFNERIYGTKPLEIKIKQKIFCELQDAVYRINNDDSDGGRIAGRTPLPQSWGVIMTVSFIVIENSSLNPSLSIISPKPSQIFTLGLGGSITSEATRTDKYTFYYPIKDLQIPADGCRIATTPDTNGRKPLDFQGSSMLLTGDLGIEEWLTTAIGVRDSSAISAPSKQEVLSYDVKFNVITSGTVNPSWSVVRVTTGQSNFLNVKRDRTHELLLTFGPIEDNLDKKKYKGRTQPSQVVLFDNLASQINSGFQSSLRSSVSRNIFQ